MLSADHEHAVVATRLDLRRRRQNGETARCARTFVACSRNPVERAKHRRRERAHLLATLPGEWHALPLQMVALYLAVGGAKSRLLGGPTPASDIVEATQMFDADIVGLTVTPASDRAEARRAIQTIVRSLPSGVPLWVGGSGAPALELEPDA